MFLEVAKSQYDPPVATAAVPANESRILHEIISTASSSLDLDEVYERVLINHGDQKTLMTIGKAGILWKLDRVTGKFIDANGTTVAFWPTFGRAAS